MFMEGSANVSVTSTECTKVFWQVNPDFAQFLKKQFNQMYKHTTKEYINEQEWPDHHGTSQQSSCFGVLLNT